MNNKQSVKKKGLPFSSDLSRNQSQQTDLNKKLPALIQFQIQQNRQENATFEKSKGQMVLVQRSVYESMKKQIDRLRFDNSVLKKQVDSIEKILENKKIIEKENILIEQAQHQNKKNSSQVSKQTLKKSEQQLKLDKQRWKFKEEMLKWSRSIENRFGITQNVSVQNKGEFYMIQKQTSFEQQCQQSQKHEELWLEENNTSLLQVESKQKQNILQDQSHKIFRSLNEIYPSKSFKNLANQEEQQQCKGSQQKQVQQTEKTEKERVPLSHNLFESICLYGPQFEQLSKQCEQDTKKIMVPPFLMYSSSQNNLLVDKFRVLSQFLYPEAGKVICRKIEQDQMQTQANKAIFRKNVKKQDCSFFMFQGQELQRQIYKKIQNNQRQNKTAQENFINSINPTKNLYAFVLPFSDYLTIQPNLDLFHQKPSQSLPLSLLPLRQQQSSLNKYHLDDRKSDRQETDTTDKFSVLVKCKYTLCIFTYYPLVNPIEQLLVEMIESIKIRRIQKFTKTDQNISEVDIDFVVSELKQIGKEIMRSVEKISLKENQERIHSISFRNAQIQIDLSPEQIYDTIYADWVYQILQTFDREQFYELLNAIVFEESICFISENIHKLTHTIFFFVSVLLFPFPYPYPIISLILQLQFLDSPITLICGTHKTSRQLTQNLKSYKTNNKIFVDMNSQVPKIHNKSKTKAYKSQRLKKIVTNFYKRESDTFPDFFKKKQTIIHQVTKEENCSTFEFIKQLRRYLREQIIDYLPNQQIMIEFENLLKGKNQIEKRINLLEKIVEYVRECRQERDKDEFINIFVQRQIFYYYLSLRYQL